MTITDNLLKKEKENPFIKDFLDESHLKPKNYSDIDEAKVLAYYYGNILKYTKETGFICYQNNHWIESETIPHRFLGELTNFQLSHANKLIESFKNEMKQKNVWIDFTRHHTFSYSEEIQKLFSSYIDALAYKKFITSRRNSNNIEATLNEVKAIIEIDSNLIDNKPYLLTTPEATFDLRKGILGKEENNPKNYITKITKVSPSDKGEKLWKKTLKNIFSNNNELIEYVQKICGLALIGQVMQEGLIICLGEGGNGKSTFWNTIARVLGNYSGIIASDTLIKSKYNDKKFELAELKGKRLIIASELEQDSILDEALIKRICSSDDIYAEKKYKSPFYFTPSHTLILYTNHLPKISSIDDGIWDRILIIPFNNRFRNKKKEKKNYSNYLFFYAGGAILKWLIEGAKKAIDSNFKLTKPKIVVDAISKYQYKNDVFKRFINDYCVLDKSYKESSSLLYQTYCYYCKSYDEVAKNNYDFTYLLKKNNLKKRIIKRKSYICGIKIKEDFKKDFLERSKDYEF